MHAAVGRGICVQAVLTVLDVSKAGLQLPCGYLQFVSVLHAPQPPQNNIHTHLSLLHARRGRGATTCSWVLTFSAVAPLEAAACRAVWRSAPPG